MSTCCPCRHISHASWRYLTIQRLFANSGCPLIRPPISQVALICNTTRRQSSTSSQTRAQSTEQKIRNGGAQNILQQGLEPEDDSEVAELGRGDGRPSQPAYESQDDGKQVSYVPLYPSLGLEERARTSNHDECASLEKERSKEYKTIKGRQKRRQWSPYDGPGREDLRSLADSLQGTLISPGNPVHDDNAAPTRYSVADGLPVSPLVQAFERARAPKSLPKGAEKEVLATNPWATMLASPVRLCTATGVRLPKDLLVPWGLVRHPATEKVYFMPTELAELDSLKDKRRQTSHFASSLPKIATIAEERPSNQEAGSSALSVNADSESDTEESGFELLTSNNRKTPTALDTRLSEMPTATKAPKTPSMIYMLPFLPLLHHLTLRLTNLQRDMVTRRNRPNAINSLLSWRSKAIIERPQFYAGQRARTPSSSATTEGANPPCLSSLRNVKWEVDIDGVMLLVLRERVLAALEMLGNRNQKLWRQQRELVRAIRVTKTSDINIREETWKLLDSDAQTESVSEKDEAQFGNDAKICLLIESKDANPDKLENATDRSNEQFNDEGDIQGSESTESQDAESITATGGSCSSFSNLEPSTIKIDQTRTVPLFPLSNLLDVDYISRFRQLSTTISVLAPRQSSTRNGDGDAYVLVVPAKAFGGKAVFEEIWRLWRFLGGRPA